MRKISAKQLAVLTLLIGAVFFASGTTGNAVAQDHGHTHGETTDHETQPNTTHDEHGETAGHGEVAGHGDSAGTAQRWLERLTNFDNSWARFSRICIAPAS